MPPGCGSKNGNGTQHIANCADAYSRHSERSCDSNDQLRDAGAGMVASIHDGTQATLC
jgi:hypothetical protein